MKINYKILLASYMLSMTLGLTFTGCAEKWDEYPWLVGDSDTIDHESEDGLGKTDINVLEGELKGAIPLMLQYGTHAYQYERTNSIDNYAGYWTTSQNNFAFGGALPTLYTYPNDYLGGPMANYVFTQAKNPIFYAEELGKPEWRAVALIIQAYVGHETTDFYGSIPFNDWRNVKRDPPLTYEKGYDVYLQIFDDLAEAIAILKERQPSQDELTRIEDGDPIYTLARGDWRRWVKFANSIRLRMAMNIVKYNAALAQQMAEASVNDEIGVFDEKKGDLYDFGYYAENSTHPVYFISVSWLDTRLGASLENILKKHDNPLLGAWFNRNSNPINTSTGVFSGIAANQDWVGIRQGVAMINKSNEKNGYGPFSTPTSVVERMCKAYLKRTEVIFLRAEGALRGWNMGGTASEFYERGIRLAFEESGITDEITIQNYLNLEKAKDVDYTDPYAPGNSIKGRMTIGVKWDESDSNEVKLEKLITQKYVAIFPQGAEAWTTFRRTGYPRLFPVKLNNMPGVDTELQIRRIPIVETTNNKDEINNSMVPAMGGPNNGGTRVFWDVQTEQRGEVIEVGTNWPEVVIPVNF